MGDRSAYNLHQKGMATIKGQVKRSVKVLKRSEREGIIPGDVLAQCEGLVFMTSIKGAWFIGATVASGIFIKRLGDDQWTPPAGIGMSSVGIGLQFGGQKTDIIIVLNDKSSVKAFESQGQLKIGGDYSISAGPIGRNAAASMGISGKGFVGMFSYSMSQGLFVGVSLEGSVLVNRGHENKSFYKNKQAHLKNIIAGGVEVPEDKRGVVKALHLALINVSHGRAVDYEIRDILKEEDLLDLDDASEPDSSPVGNEAFVYHAATAPAGHNTKDDDDLTRRAVKKSPPPPPTLASQNASGRDMFVAALDATEKKPASSSAWGNPFDDPPQATVDIPPQATVYTPPQTSVYSRPDLTYTTPLVAGAKAVLNRDHIVEEGTAHNLVSGYRGDPCNIVDGTLEAGLPSPYQDYVTIQFLTGKTGKISKYCLMLT